MKTRALQRSLIPLLLLLFSPSSPGIAEIRFPMPDVDVVQKAEWIVAGVLKPGSLRMVERPPGSSNDCWYHGTLVAREVLAGPDAPAELPVFLAPGVIEPCFVTERQNVYRPPERIDDTAWVTKVILNINYDWSWQMDHVEDTYAGEVLWFLHPWRGEGEAPDGWPTIGITSAEQVQLLEYRGYLLAYREQDPETAVAAIAARLPELGYRAEVSLNQLAYVRAKAEPDTSRRLELFAEALLRGAGSRSGEVWEELLNAGSAALPALSRTFYDPQYAAIRWSILSLYREIGDPSVVPELVEVLASHVAFFARQDMGARGWYESGTLEERGERSRREIELHYGAGVLGELGDAQAIPVLEAALKQWQGHPQGGQIADVCRRAIAQLLRSAPASRDGRGAAEPRAEEKTQGRKQQEGTTEGGNDGRPGR